MPYVDSVYIKLAKHPPLEVYLDENHPQLKKFLKVFTGGEADSLVKTELHSFKRIQNEGECFSIGKGVGLINEESLTEGEEIKSGAVLVPMNFDSNNLEVKIYVSSWPTRRSSEVIGQIKEGSVYLKLIRPSMFYRYEVEDIGVIADFGKPEHNRSKFSSCMIEISSGKKKKGQKFRKKN